MQLRYITVREIVGLGIFSKTKLYDLVQKGVFPPPIKIGSRSFWKHSDIENGLKKLEEDRFQ